MPRKIQVLPESITKAIAAGEVVERPASVVKELMENSIDAGATEVVVELKMGGLHLIRVQDNGEGIEPEDLPLALQRYATSKLKTLEDLYQITTLGFRGEALPSIASVSKMTIKTRVRDSIVGTKVLCEGGVIKNISSVGGPVGTEIEVKSLFYNVPVKRKFLKSIPSELRQSMNHFLRLSLSHPTISFKLIHEGRILQDHLGTDSLRVRIESVLGREAWEQMKPFEFEDGEIRVLGYASLPTFSKRTAEGIYLYVNQRGIRDRLLYKAILEAYRHLLPGGRYPGVVLFISLPPSSVDVNVHPTKAEVKFKDPERVYQGVVRALRSLQEKEIRYEERRGSTKSLEIKEEFLPSFGNSSLFDPSLGLGKEKEDFLEERIDPKPWSKPHELPRIVGQVQGTYILCEEERGLIFIDQHAAHERALFERFKREVDTHSFSINRFLVPISLEFSAEESFLLTSYLERLQKMGFEIDPIGRDVFALRAIPSFFEPKEAKELIRHVLEELANFREGEAMEEEVETILVAMACHSAIRANFPLRKEEMEELVKSLYPFDLSMTCPHGRPIFFLVREKDLAKQFKRSSP